MLEGLAQSDDDDIEPAIYYEAGPFVHPRDFYLLSFNRAKQPTHEIEVGMLKPLFTLGAGTARPKFVLTRLDLKSYTEYPYIRR
ncbi:hypothetical protein BDDG_12169 [Blastomyces dermatitidis ATCC 18188]|uniref:Uncharacterized protein n=1 Tax=Ajellomyces dermatitidis (strain ATCC 18188 / CBS 674.68) TaxID=653446 RepID=A0A0J9ENA5_AJEDA|nr:hypothetical protein BDDG_12169 [Blastomyces dermatitidis ATCC 18188]